MLDGAGVTIAVNVALERFAAETGSVELRLGSGYLGLCDAAAAEGDEQRGQIAMRLRELLAGSRESFTADYVLDPAAATLRRFGVRAGRFRGAQRGRVVMEHFDKTAFVEAQENARLRSELIDRIDAAIIATDLDGVIELWSRGAEQIFGWSEQEVVGREVSALVLPPGEPDLGGAVVAAIRATGSRFTERPLRRRDGTTFFGHISSVLRHDDQGRPVGIIAVAIDVSDRVRAAEELRHARDHLRAVTDSMGEALCTLDTFGHVSYMNETAQRLLGWDVEELQGRTLHEAVHYRRPDGSPYPIEECPLAAAQSERTPLRVDDDLFVRRDGSELPVAYTSTPFQSVEGGGSVLVFSDITPTKAKQLRLQGEVERLSQVRDVQDALREQRFELYAQPIVDLSTGAIASHELLLRMRMHDGSIRSPATFLAAAESSGLVRELDRWVIGQGARLAGLGYRIELNVSATSLGDPGLYDDFAGSLREFGADPARVVIELTETALMQEESLGRSFMKRIAALGCEIALDDFGSGYGGFAYLKNLPVDYLKIDTEFVTDLGTNVSSRHVVQAVVGLAAGFGSKTVAEGVEDDEILDIIERLGVDFAQGFGIGRPAPLQDTLYSAG